MKRAATKTEDTQPTQTTEQTTQPIAKRLHVAINDGMLYVQIPIAPRPSSSGRSTVVATTEGSHFASCKYQGHELHVSVSATYRNAVITR